MPIPLFNSIASWFLKKSIHQIQLFMKYPNEVQQELLHNLLNISSKTEIGLKYDFKTIKNYQDFKNRIPIVSYENIFDQIERCRNGEQNILQIFFTDELWLSGMIPELMPDHGKIMHLYLINENYSQLCHLHPKRNKENIATTKDGIKVKTENIEIYFKFVCEPVLFFLPV